METIYNISNKEINRRIKAYTTFIDSFLIGIILFSLNYIVQYYNIFLYILLILTLFLFVSRIIVIKYLKSLLKTNIGLTPLYIRKNKTKYFIKNIKKILIKKTTNGSIREVNIKLNNGNTYINNSMNNTDDFIIRLQEYLPKEVINKTIQEPINYDHPTFYFFLGTILSFVSIASIKFLLNSNTDSIKLISYITFLLSIILGIYFVTYKPIYKRDEKEGRKSDYIWGGFFIVGAVAILLSIII